MAKENNGMALASANDSRAIAPVKPAGLNVFADAQNFDMALRMADCLAKSTVVPREYQGNTGNCMIAIEMASRINTSPMMVMQNLYIVNGRPAWSSQWIISMINSSRRYKTELQYEFGNEPADGGLSCRAWAEDYSGHKVYGPKITMNMANAEGWVNKNGSKWKTMPEVMIQYRAASFFGRMNCPDMIMGIYSQDEAIDMVDMTEADCAMILDPDGNVQEITIPKDEPATNKQRQELFKVANEVFGEGANDALMAMLKEEGLDSTNGMLTSVLERIKAKIIKIGEDSKADSNADS